MTTSIHDHHVLELAVAAVERTIRLRTAYPERTGPDFTDVVLEDVEGYVFRGDALGTILFDIESVDAITLIASTLVSAARLHQQRGPRSLGAERGVSRSLPGGWTHPRYRLSSPIGLEGAVWARRLLIRNG